MSAKRTSRSVAFNAQVTLAAVKGDQTVNEQAAHFGVQPTLDRGEISNCRAG